MIGGLIRDVRALRALVKCSRLAGTVYTPAGVQIWMSAKNRNLGGRSPIDMILAGHGDLAVREAERLAAL